MSWHEIRSSLSFIAAQKTLHCTGREVSISRSWHGVSTKYGLLPKAAELVQPPVVEIAEAELQALVDEFYA